MTINKLMFACALALAACGGKSNSETTTPASPDTSTSNTDGTTGAASTGDGQPCSQEVALQCPEGQVDACLKTPPAGETHTCVAQ